MIRRTITIVLMGLAFYGGIRIERILHETRCDKAGGQTAWNGVCQGVPKT